MVYDFYRGEKKKKVKIVEGEKCQSTDGNFTVTLVPLYVIHVDGIKHEREKNNITSGVVC